MDPAKAVETETIYVLNHIFETLYITSADGQSVEPWLVEGEELSEDELTWTFDLRDGVLFSDGSPMTSADVKFSVERAASDESGFGFLLAAIDTIETPDEDTVVMTTKYPWRPLLADLALWSGGIMPADFGGRSEEEFFEEPVGTGPFVLDAWDRGQSLKVVRNDDYWQDGKPFVDSVTWTVVPEANTRVIQVQGGQAHIVSDIPFNSIENLNSSEEVNAQGFPGTTVYYIMFNAETAPYDDVHVRRAIAHAIDKEGIAGAVLFGNGTAACSIIAPTVTFHDPETPCLQYDVEAARAELEQSSVPEGFEARILVGDEPTQVAAVEIIQAQLAEIGITVTIDSIDPGQFYETLSSMDYEMGLAGWSMDIPDPDEQISFMLDKEQGGANSYSTAYEDPRITELLRDAQREFDDEARAALYSELQAVHAEEVPHIPVYFQATPFAWSVQVNGLHVNPVGNRHLEDVWLSE